MSEKTCGNCGNVYATQLLCRHAEEDWEHGSLSYYAGITSLNAKPCAHWVKGDDTLEQRYEQLEQVARDLYNSAWTSEFLRMCAEMPHADRELKERVADGWLQNEREKLRELGVILDD